MSAVRCYVRRMIPLQRGLAITEAKIRQVDDRPWQILATGTPRTVTARPTRRNHARLTGRDGRSLRDLMNRRRIRLQMRCRALTQPWPVKTQQPRTSKVKPPPPLETRDEARDSGERRYSKARPDALTRIFEDRRLHKNAGATRRRADIALRNIPEPKRGKRNVQEALRTTQVTTSTHKKQRGLWSKRARQDSWISSPPRSWRARQRSSLCWDRKVVERGRRKLTPPSRMFRTGPARSRSNHKPNTKTARRPSRAEVSENTYHSKYFPTPQPNQISQTRITNTRRRNTKRQRNPIAAATANMQRPQSRRNWDRAPIATTRRPHGEADD